jgi:hypothetical protein
LIKYEEHNTLSELRRKKTHTECKGRYSVARNFLNVESFIERIHNIMHIKYLEENFCVCACVSFIKGLWYSLIKRNSNEHGGHEIKLKVCIFEAIGLNLGWGYGYPDRYF